MRNGCQPTSSRLADFAQAAEVTGLTTWVRATQEEIGDSGSDTEKAARLSSTQRADLPTFAAPLTSLLANIALLAAVSSLSELVEN